MMKCSFLPLRGVGLGGTISSTDFSTLRVPLFMRSLAYLQRGLLAYYIVICEVVIHTRFMSSN